MKRQTIYISPDISSWHAMPSSGLILPDKDKQRAYDHLHRAEHFLSLSNSNVADLTDSLSNLRRALTHRLQLIEKIYQLRAALEAGRKKPFLELLAEVGVVRPTLLRALLEARNAVEYRDRRPPSKKRCLELADSVWYFLRSTDPLVSVKRSYTEVGPTEDGYLTDVYSLSFSITYSRRFRIAVHGWLPNELVSLQEQSWWRIEADDFGIKADRWSASPHHEDKKDTDYWFRGTMPNVRDTTVQILTLVFGAV